MPAANFKKIRWGVIVWCLLSIGICHASEAGREDSIVTSLNPESGISGRETETSSERPQKETSSSRGILSGLMGVDGIAEDMHSILDEERIKILSEVDKERQATLAYLTRERLAATEDMGKGLDRIVEVLSAERKTALNSLEAIGSRIAEKSIADSKQLIDHFFLRLAQFTVILCLVAGLVAFFLFRVKNRIKIEPLG